MPILPKCHGEPDEQAGLREPFNCRSGRTLYHYLGDKGTKIGCTGACAAEWPPLLLTGGAKPVAGTGILASKLGSIKRPDGTIQVTYNKLPLYRFAGDTKAGLVKGQGLDKTWYAIAPSARS